MGKWAISYLDDEEGAAYYAAIVDEQGYAIHTHPIPFGSQREAERAVARLNAREGQDT